MFPAILFLIAASPPLSPYLFCGPEGCPTSGEADWAPIFERALDHEMCSPRDRKRQGCKLELECNFDYVMSKPLDICRPHWITGCGAGRVHGSTRLIFQGTDGVKKFGLGQCPRNPESHGGAEGAILEGIVIEHRPASKDPNGPLGLELHASVSLEHVLVTGFGRGVLQICGVEGKNPGNCNAWDWTKLHVRNTAGYGIDIRGADVNGGYGLGLDVGSVCQYAPLWTQRELSDKLRTDPPCWGIRSDAFISSAFYSPFVATVMRKDLKASYPPYLVNLKTSSPGTIVVAPYQELQNTASEFHNQATIVGNASQLKSATGSFLGKKSRGMFAFTNEQSLEATPMKTHIGDPPGSDTWIQLWRKGAQFFLSFDPKTKRLAFAGQSPSASKTQIDATGQLWVKTSTGGWKKAD